MVPWAQLFDPPYALRHPQSARVPVVVNSPHSGNLYPESFLAASRLSPMALRRSEDAYVDKLFEIAPKLGAPQLSARFPRAFLDLNREPWELDPAMFASTLPPHANTTSVRVAAGLGTIPRIVSEQLDIYQHPILWAEGEARINQLYFPYHACLTQLCAQVEKNFGAVLLLDCHSMPASAVSTGMPDRRAVPDVVLGDRHGTACDGAITTALETLFAAEGLRTTRNKPYAGGFITQTHGKPRQNRHAIQIELCRALYMDEATLEPSPSFAPLQALLARVMGKLFAQLPELLLPKQLAAE